MTRALAYIRVSSREQGAADRYSLPEQERRLRAYAAEHSYTVVGLLSDTESGRRDDRPQYQQMLARLRAREADVVIVRWLDRFGRRPREILSRIWELQDAGVRVECSDEDIAEELILLVRAALAGKESERLAARVKPAMAARAAEGKWSGQIAFGYRYSASGKPEIDPSPRCRAVDRAFTLYDPTGSERLSVLGVADRLRAEGYSWTRRRVHRTLSNPIYVGDVLSCGQTVRDNHPARVSRDQWERVQTRLHARQRNVVTRDERPDLLAAGLVYCEGCAKRMRHVYTRPRPSGRRYGMWVCDRHMDHQSCSNRGCSDLAMERALREALRGLRLPSADEIAAEAERLSRERSEDSGATLRISDLEAEVVRLRGVESRLIDMRANGEIDRRQFAERVQAVRHQLADAQALLRALKAESASPDLTGLLITIREAAEMLAGDLTDVTLRVVVHVLVERIMIGEDRQIDVRWQPGVCGF